MTPVRAALSEDRAGILALCASLHAENGQHAICWPKVEAVIDRCIAKSGGVIGVIGEPGAPVGMIVLVLDEVWYSEEHQLLEYLNFVHEDHRRSDYAKSLIGYAKGCSEALGLDLTIGVLSRKRLAAKIGLYSRMLPKGGEFFVYEPASKGAAMLEAAE